MKTRHIQRNLLVTIFIVALTLLTVTSCVGVSSQASSFYDAGATNFTITGAQFVQYFLFRFDTGAASRSFTLPSAADIVSAVSSPVVGEVLIFGLTADGANAVTLSGGANVTISASASTVTNNTTLTMYCVLDNVSSGSEAVTIY